MFASSIPKEEIRNLPLIKFDGTAYVIETDEQLKAAMQRLSQESVIGFDTETKPTFTKGEYNHTAIIQLSTLEEAYIIRINTLGISDVLCRLLEDENILKVGISIRDDLKELIVLREMQLAGFVDLNDIAKDLGITQIGMKSLTGIFLGARVSKSQQTSNWETKELSAGQIAYAATDSWICIKIYQMLLERGYL